MLSMRKKKAQLDDEDAYYEGGDESASGTNLPPRLVVGGNAQDEEIDPLEAFMLEIQAEAKQEMAVSHAKAYLEATTGLGKRQPIAIPSTQFAADEDGESAESEEDITQQMTKMAERKSALEAQGQAGMYGAAVTDTGGVDMDVFKAQRKANGFEVLESLDHSSKNYTSFEKNLYTEHPEVAELSEEIVDQIRKDLQIALYGPVQKRPVFKFEHMGLPQSFLEEIQHLGYLKPTPIQAQAVPMIMSGLDVVGIAETGSGKTFAYVWPLLVHISRQPPAKQKEGPAGIILCPTRELGMQILKELKKFGKLLGVRSISLLGGEDKQTQWQELLRGVDLLVGTPGRVIDIYRKKGIKLNRVTFVVVDEADRMFGMGFEKQLKSILGQIRPDRQLVLLSATFNKKVRDLVEQYLVHPSQIVIGKRTAASNIKQEIVVMDTVEEKLDWLTKNLVSMIIHGYVLIFVSTIKQTSMLDQALGEFLPEIPRGVLHGDMMQHERAGVLAKFKKSGMILIATDVASRGLDVPAIGFVINFEVPKDQDAYIHRVGRTGRGGREGVAITLLLKNEKRAARFISAIFERSQESVPEDLRMVAGGVDSASEGNSASQQASDEDRPQRKRTSGPLDASSKLLRKALASGQRTKKGLGYKPTGKPKKHTAAFAEDLEENKFNHGQEHFNMVLKLKEKSIQLERDRLMGRGPGFDNPNKSEHFLGDKFKNFESFNNRTREMTAEEYKQAELEQFEKSLKSQLQMKFRNQFVSGGMLKGNHNSKDNTSDLPN